MKYHKKPTPTLDDLTRLPTKGSIETALEDIYAHCITRLGENEQTNYSLVLFDIEYFKAINDLFGHSQGDNVLKQISELLKEYQNKNQSAIGILGRWGGEEFLMALPEIPSYGAAKMAEEIRKTISGSAFENIDTGEPLERRITVSLGVSTIDVAETVENHKKSSEAAAEERIQTLKDEADCALSYAKFLGKDRVQVFHKYLEKEMERIDTTRRFYFRFSGKPLQI